MKKILVGLCVVLLLAGGAYFFSRAGVQERDFFELCTRGTPEEVERAIKAGADAKTKDTRTKDRHGNPNRTQNWTPLQIAACFNGNPEVLRVLVENGADLEAVDGIEWTAMHRAAYHNNNPEVLRVLLEKGANINAKTNRGLTPLMLATADINGYPKLKNVFLLLESGADAGVTNNAGKRTADYLNEMLLKLCEIGTPEEVEQTIKIGADVKAVDKDNWTTLHIATWRNNNPEMLRVLLENGANSIIEARDKNGMTALMNAAGHGRAKHVLLLLDAGADPSLKINKNTTINLPNSRPDGVDKEDWSMMIKRLDSAPRASDAAMSVDDFFKLCEEGTAEEVERVIEAGVNSNAVNDSGLTALYYAAVNDKNPGVAKILIEKGADVNAGNKDNATPLMRASEKYETSVVSLLIAEGADVNAVTTEDGWMAIHYAATNTKNPEVIKILLKNGADVNAASKSNGTPLTGASGYNHVSVISLLIAEGANVNAATNSGWQPIHFAANSNPSPEALKILLKNGADLNARNNDGATPLMRAARAGMPKNISMLLDSGADVRATDNDGKTAADYLPESTPYGVGEAEWKAAAERLRKAR